jgi:hypothetical protein
LYNEEYAKAVKHTKICAQQLGWYKSTPKISQNVHKNLSKRSPTHPKSIQRKQSNVQELPGDGIFPLPMLLLRSRGQSIVGA